jgi:Tfp pilus assembly protein PilF
MRTLTHFRKNVLLCVALCAASTPLVLRAEDPPAKEFSEKVSSEFIEIRPLLDAKKYDEALKRMDALIAEIAVESYDFIVLSQMKSQIILQQGGDMGKAIEPLEKSLTVGEKLGLLEKRELYEQTSMLSQLYYQKAVEMKDPAAQQENFNKSYGYVKRAISLAPKPTLDLHMFAASLLYNQGSLSTTPDPEKFKLSLVEARKASYLSIKPPEQLYQLMLSCLQQLGDMDQAAEILELMLEVKPKNQQPWQQLVAIYMTLASKSKDEARIQHYNLRAILAIERAQALGFLASPRENYTLVALYFTLQQFGRAATLLEKGLTDGSLESQKKNWELLANAYQQLNQENRAIDALKRATAIFPKEGQLDFTLGQLYYAQGKVDEAYTHSVQAATKGQLEKPGQAFLYLAYLGYELKKLEEASRWVEQASTFADVKPADLAQIKSAINAAIKEREALATPTKA